jgi:tetratricopeptide (TPR) repeat protein
MLCSRCDVLRLFALIGLLLSFGPSVVLAQEEEESAESKQYREDYDRLQKAVGVSDPLKRADLLYDFMKDRPNSKVFDYAQGNYLLVLEGLSKAEKYPQVITLAERFIKLRPRVGETYYFYGAALKNLQRYPEAISALAKCAVTKNSAARKAREFLEYVYRSQNSGSIVGLDRILKQAQTQMGQ